MPKVSVVIYGPKGCGKTTHGNHLKLHFGLERIADEGAGRIGKIEPTCTLYLCVDRPSKPKLNGAIAISFETAMQMAANFPPN